MADVNTDRITSRTLALAAVGAPFAARRAVRERMRATGLRLRSTVVGVAEETERRIEALAEEGERVVSTVSGTAPIDELTTRVDFERIEDRVSRARRQLEDVVAAWRESGRRPGEPAPEPKTPPAPKAPPKGGARTATRAAGTSRSTAAKGTGQSTAAKSTEGTRSATPKSSAGKTSAATKRADDGAT